MTPSKGSKPLPQTDVDGQLFDPAAGGKGKQLSLYFKIPDWQVIKRITEFEHVSTREALSRSARTRWRIITADQPQLRWPNLPADKLPEPERLAFVGIMSGRVREIDLGM